MKSPSARWTCRFAIGLCVFVFAPRLAFAAPPEPKIDYGRQIKPILSSQCFRCHGADEKARKGGLRLDTREGAIKTGASGVYGIVPGKPESSEVVDRIIATDGRLMPPGARNRFTAEQVELIKQWIKQGADYTVTE